MSPIVDSDNGADSDDSSDNTMSLSSVYSNASRPCSTLVNVSDSECALVNLDCNQSSDPGLWLLPFSSELVDFWIEKGPIACQNNDGAFLKSKRVYNAKGKKVNRKLKADSFKRIKNESRASTTEDRLNNLTLMSIESDLLNDIDFNDIISDFASRKSRSVPI
jgi:hypothetical protein